VSQQEVHPADQDVLNPVVVQTSQYSINVHKATLPDITLQASNPLGIETSLVTGHWSFLGAVLLLVEGRADRIEVAEREWQTRASLTLREDQGLALLC
jgi:hypothetical protein